MKFWSLLVWVIQFGFSALFPICFFLLLGTWLCNTYGLDQRVLISCGVLGALTTVRTVRACIRSLRKEAEQASENKDTPVAFNEHE